MKLSIRVQDERQRTDALPNGFVLFIRDFSLRWKINSYYFYRGIYRARLKGGG